MITPSRQGLIGRLTILLCLMLILPACREQTHSAAAPSVYLLNHQHWTTVLVLNFTDALAPPDDNGEPLTEALPELQPAIEGEWRWQDPSRLVFYPKTQTLKPDAIIRISLDDLKLHPSYTLEQTLLKFHTPALQVIRQQCRWIDTDEAPLRRSLEFLLELNYPVVKPVFSAALANGTAIAMHAGEGTRITAISDPLLRPAEDTGIKALFAAGNVQLLTADRKLVETAELASGAECELPVKRSDWDKSDTKQVPTVSGIAVDRREDKLLVSLKGQALAESATKANAGKPVESGIAINPAIEGSWKYGEVAGGADLLFTPKTPDLLKPGTHYQITLDQGAFPNVRFEKPQYSAELAMPDMRAEIASLQLYSDPQAPKIKRLTATLAFSYPPQRDSLAAKVAVWSRTLPAKRFENALAFEISYDDKHPLLAYLKSAPIQIGDAPSEIKLVLDKGIAAASGGQPSQRDSYRTLAIPSALDYLQISELELNSVIKEDDTIERLIVLKTNVPLQDPTQLENAVQVFILPDCSLKNPERPMFCAQKRITEWQSPNQVDAEVLKASTPVSVAWRDSGSEDKREQHLNFSAPENRQLLVTVNKGLESVDGFRLTKDARYLKELGANQRELKILHEGSLLSLSGDKKLGVTTRGVNQVKVQLQRILPHNMHHLVQFTSGSFQNPDFNLPIEHFAETYSYDEILPAGQAMQRQYFAVDFGRFTKTNGYPPRGLFLLSVAEKKPEPAESCQNQEEAGDDDSENQQYAEGEENDSEQNGCDADTDSEVDQDKRLVLLTDMGLLAKTASDGKQTIFVMSFRTGQPVAGAQVSLLGMNGVAVFSGKTDAQGQVNFPTTEGLKAEKTPTVYLAEKDGDLSFLPFNRDNRQLDVSRFDIDGLHDSADSLQAYLFSDRGIYRPGDTVNIGLILRKRDWSPLPAGLPLKAVIRDPELQEVWSRTLGFGAEGFEEISWTSPAAGKTGTYRVELIVADKSKKSLGSTRVRVEEFQPDRLQVKTELLNAPAKGWIVPEGAKARITVRNLFGTAAEGNVAKLELTARPWAGQVPGFSDYRFRRSAPENIPDTPQALGEVKTNAEGEAIFDLPLAGIAEPVYEISLAGEGFEKGSGRSVIAMATALVSSQRYLLGYKADGSLDYISKDSPRKLSLLALGADFQPRQNESLTAGIFEVRYVSTLVKREDGLYQYQSVQRQELRNSQPVTLQNGRADFTLPSDNPGRFYVLFKNSQGETLNRADYTVAGDGNVSRNVERNAELNLTLNKAEYQPGETLEVQIVAPYQGAGLITVEQDGVLTSQWFKIGTTASSQKITLPDNISGNAYLSVAFVRSLDSREIYMSPLSYGVVPFSISKQRYTQNISLKVPEKVRPGSTLDVSYHVNEATKLVLYAVDEGILQFAHYSNPAPLDYFFRKRALQVKSHQILDLILPDFALVHKLSAPGGDEDAQLGKYKNPFARKHKAPMAFWSGIIAAEPGENTLSIPVPDYFNGKIRVIAVAVNAGKLAVPVSQTVAAQAYVIQPQQPYVAAPGDEFDMGVLVANNSEQAGKQDLQVSVAAGEVLELLSPNPQTLSLNQGQDGTVRFHAKVKDKLGPVNVQYQVAGGSETAGYSEEMSIRPSQPLLTTLQGGVLTVEQQRKGEVRKLDLQRDLYPEQRQTELALSLTPAAYLRGIVEFLKNYPYGCTEQIASQAFPAAVLGANPELGLSAKDVQTQLERSIRTLQTRQKHDGSFGYWTAADEGMPFYSMYATHMLLEAKDRSHNVPEAMLQRALAYADEFAQSRQYTPDQHDAKAYAFYLLARNGQNVAERLRAFEADLQSQSKSSGQPIASRSRFFIGAAYKLHHLDQDAERQFDDIRQQWQTSGILPTDMQNNPENLSLYLYLVGKHLPELLDTQDPKFGGYMLELGQDLVGQRMNSFRGSMALLGLGSLWTRFEQDQQQSFTVLAGTPLAQLELQGKSIKTALLTPTIRPLELRGEGKWSLYYQLSETGYDRAPPSAAISQKLTVNRQMLNDKGEAITRLGLQDKLHIRIALHPDQAMRDVAVVMLVPGGFEIDLSEHGLAERKSLPIDKKPLWQPEYIDVQEDRLVLFGDLDGGEKYFEFRLKPLNSGTYQVPPVFAEGMYDTEILYRGLGDTIKVEE
ncbi:alpha-2-macroglobulin family protein [Methylomonas methanica]|uniref:Alpha-2-macroglobulin domain protein n=1 Tax=Methylomonas methanica (strain DSM 25384 / MC09) TaxID=857087 RepID=F9ZWL0_METMM|nr:alpha-2-macroglobulin [Methylomonas methanica]AEG00857.1 alpha-2-macroglobulin domain protein [Methylomonas methanica MC09]